MNGQTEKQIHDIYVKMRKEMCIHDVREVESFDENGAVLQTSLGVLTIEGGDLKVETLDTDRGIVLLKGRIDGVYYSVENQEERSGLFKKLFR